MENKKTLFFDIYFLDCFKN